MSFIVAKKIALHELDRPGGVSLRDWPSIPSRGHIFRRPAGVQARREGWGRVGQVEQMPSVFACNFWGKVVIVIFPSRVRLLPLQRPSLPPWPLLLAYLLAVRCSIGPIFHRTNRVSGLHASARRSALAQFNMPAMSPTMTEGGIASWKKKEGDTFSTGEVLLEIVSTSRHAPHRSPS